MKIRRFMKEDASAVSQMIRRNFLEVNRRDYSEDVINSLVDRHDPAKVLDIAENSHMYVAVDGQKIVGCGAVARMKNNVKECLLLTIFVQPDYHGMGVGRLIIDTLEKDDIAVESRRVELHASITARGFYEKLGYRYIASRSQPDDDGLYPMEKFKYE